MSTKPISPAPLTIPAANTAFDGLNICLFDNGLIHIQVIAGREFHGAGVLAGIDLLKEDAEALRAWLDAALHPE